MSPAVLSNTEAGTVNVKNLVTIHIIKNADANIKHGIITHVICAGCKKRQYTRHMTRASGMLMMINISGGSRLYRKGDVS